MVIPTSWRFLIVDDEQADEIAAFVSGPKLFGPDSPVAVVTCQRFDEALEKVGSLRVDLIILDLRDQSIPMESDDIELPGESVYNQIRSRLFVPIVFYTAYPIKVKDSENPFVKVVSRDDPRRLREAIQEIFDTGLPELTKHLEAEQREYMWEHIGTHWPKCNEDYEKTDLTYLLARRLSSTLSHESVRRFIARNRQSSQQPDSTKIHPIEMYVYPPVNPVLQVGDILRGSFSIDQEDRIGQQGFGNSYWIVLTPSCYLEHGKAEQILLARCDLLEEQSEFIAVQADATQSRTKMGFLEDLVKDNRKGAGIQRERYKFLPGTFFLPDLVIDYQALAQVQVGKLDIRKRIVSLDSPFAEAVLTKFTRYYSQIGTPDIDVDLVCKRAIQKHSKGDQAAQITPTPVSKARSTSAPSDAETLSQ